MHKLKLFVISILAAVFVILFVKASIENNCLKERNIRIQAVNDSLRNANTLLTLKKKPAVYIQRMKPGKIVD